MKLRPQLGALCALVVVVCACGSSSPRSSSTAPQPVDTTKVVTVVVSPATVTGGLASSLQYSAVQENANGDSIAGTALTWKSSDTTVVTISNTGLASGVGIGTATITATSGTAKGTATATVILHPNEPPGLTRFGELDFSGLPAAAGLPGTLAGNFYTEVSPASHMAILTDSTALQSPKNVLQIDFEKGTNPGFDVGVSGGYRQFGGWDLPSALSNTEYSEFYESDLVKIPTPDFETQLDEVKLFGYWGVDSNNESNATGSGPIELVGMIAGNGTNTAIMSSWHIDMVTQNIVTVRLNQNLNVTKMFTAGTWHQFEVYMKLNTIGQSNGIWKWWLDGVPIGDYENFTFIDSTHAAGFWGKSLHPVWGGQGGTPKTRTDYVWFNHIYMSGKFLRAAAPCGC